MSDTHIVVHDSIRISNDRGNLLVPCIIFVAVCMYWKWVLLALGVAVALFGCWYLYRSAKAQALAQAARDDATRARADRQLYGYMSGDPRATYGWESSSEGPQP